MERIPHPNETSKRHRLISAPGRIFWPITRGLSLIRRIKAICWWCHQHTGHPESAAWLVADAITDQRIEELTNKRGRKARRARTRRSEFPTGTAPASTGTNSTPAPDTQTPPTSLYPQTHILAYNPHIPHFAAYEKALKPLEFSGFRAFLLRGVRGIRTLEPLTRLTP